MILPFSHDAMEVRQQNALAGVEHPAAVFGSDVPVPAFAPPKNTARLSLVSEVYGLSDGVQVRNRIVRFIKVNVMNFILAGINAVIHIPSKAMRTVCRSFVSNTDVSAGLRGSSRVAGLDVSAAPNSPCKEPSFRVVGESIPDRIWYKFCSHLKSPLHLVRGSVVGATDTPILRQIAHKLNIGGLNG